MRQIKYLSPTSIKLFESDREEFYLHYCADNRPPRLPQTRPMAIGAAFDAFVKNYLVGSLYDSGDSLQEKFTIEKIFEDQVEPQNRDWALEHGLSLFNAYRESGALANLMIEYQNASETPQFEFTIERRVAHSAFIDGIPLLGKPDAHFRMTGGQSLVNDWKVNGYCGKQPTSPKKGYVRLLPGGSSHKDAQLMTISGISTNIATTLDNIDKDWATQLCIYMWVLGEPVGTKAIVGIEQLACQGLESCVGMRVASHRCRISAEFQLSLLSRIASMWDCIQSGWIFNNLSIEESSIRCSMLDQQYAAYNQGEGVNEDWFRSITRE